MAPPIHGPAEEVRLAIVSPDKSAVEFLEIFGESQASKRVRPLAVVIVWEYPVMFANKYDHLSFSCRSLIDGVNVRQVRGQLAPETIDLNWVVRFQTVLSYSPEVLLAANNLSIQLKLNGQALITLSLKINNSLRMIEMAS